MKYQICILFLILFFILPTYTKTQECLPISTEVPAEGLLINETDPQSSQIFFGMSQEELSTVLDQQGIEQDGQCEITDEPSSWDFGNIVVSAKNMDFSFDKKDQLYAITVYGDVSTALGLDIGDSEETMKKLYGSEFKQSETDSAVIYEYQLDTWYFVVFMKNEQVSSWKVSQRSFFE